MMMRMVMVMAMVVMMMVLMMVVHGANGESSYIHGVRSNPLCGMSFLLICLKFVIYDDDDEEEEEDHTRMLTSRLHSTTQCLTTARRSVTDLESQLVTAKSLVNQLEMEVDRLSLDLKREARRRTRRPPGSHRGLPALLDRCSVCLSVPRPPLLPLQCPQGHVFCSECGAR